MPPERLEPQQAEYWDAACRRRVMRRGGDEGEDPAQGWVHCCGQGQDRKHGR
jgi:hypothetical protein